MPHAGHAAQVGKAVLEQRRRSRSLASTSRSYPAGGHFSAALDTPLRRPETRQSVQSVGGRPVWEGGTRSCQGTPDVSEYSTKALAAHRRWVRRNRVVDSSAALQKEQQGSCSSGAALNLLLYVGLGMSSVGLIVTFVGLGERGFQTTGLKLIGPCLLFTGLFLIILRVFLCTIGAACAAKLRRREDRRELISTGELRAAQSGRPLTQPSQRSRHSGSTRHSSPPPTPHEETSTVPVLPPININHLSGGGGPSSTEVLLNPKELDRPPSAGSVMSPLAPTQRRQSHLEHINSDIDEMLRQQ